jgi:hypothetical protein
MKYVKTTWWRAVVSDDLTADIYKSDLKMKIEILMLIQVMIV